MDWKNIPRNYTLGFILLTVIVLTVALVLEPGSLLYKDQTDYAAQQKQAELENQQYAALLASVQPNYQASQEFLQKVASEDIVRAQVEAELQPKQNLSLPQVSSSEVKLASRDDRDTTINYLNSLGSMISNYNSDITPKLTSVFSDNPDTAAIQQAQNSTNALLNNLRGMQVPPSSKDLQLAQIGAYEEYADFLSTATAYGNGTNSDPWSSVYGQYAAISNRLDVVHTEYNQLQQKFALQDSDFTPQGLSFVKTAQAQFSVVDIWNSAWEGIKVGLAKAFANFAIKMLDKVVTAIEKDFAIASQLYYNNELGRYYSVEYMKKFVTDPLDQGIIQQFLPQYFCVPTDPAKLKDIFVAKAAQNRANDIVLDPSDPQFLQKLARLGGDEKNYPEWWQSYYEGLAAQTQASAENAANNEVQSNGLKSGRDLISDQITKTTSSIFNVQEAAISGTIQLGTSNADNPVSQIVSGIVESLINKFVFTPLGGTSNGGGIGVIKEQNVCLTVPQIKPIVPIASTEGGGGNTSTPPVPPITITPSFNPR